MSTSDSTDCGSPVTLEVGPDRPLSTSLSDAVLAAEEDELFPNRCPGWLVEKDIDASIEGGSGENDWRSTVESNLMH